MIKLSGCSTLASRLLSLAGEMAGGGGWNHTIQWICTSKNSSLLLSNVRVLCFCGQLIASFSTVTVLNLSVFLKSPISPFTTSLPVSADKVTSSFTEIREAYRQELLQLPAIWYQTVVGIDLSSSSPNRQSSTPHLCILSFNVHTDHRWAC